MENSEHPEIPSDSVKDENVCIKNPLFHHTALNICNIFQVPRNLILWSFSHPQIADVKIKEENDLFETHEDGENTVCFLKNVKFILIDAKRHSLNSQSINN